MAKSSWAACRGVPPNACSRAPSAASARSSTSWYFLGLRHGLSASRIFRHTFIHARVGFLLVDHHREAHGTQPWLRLRDLLRSTGGQRRHRVDAQPGVGRPDHLGAQGLSQAQRPLRHVVRRRRRRTRWTGPATLWRMGM